MLTRERLLDEFLEVLGRRLFVQKRMVHNPPLSRAGAARGPPFDNGATRIPCAGAGKRSHFLAGCCRLYGRSYNFQL
jgi:hypothetical protein